MPNSSSSSSQEWFIPTEFLYNFVEEVEESPDFSENLLLDLKDFRKKIQLIQMDDGMSVHVLAINIKNQDLNMNHLIPALSGDPINVGVYDLVKDCYHVECFSHCDLGSIPINYKLCIKGSYDWMQDVPLPLCVIERYLNSDQKDHLNSWRENLAKLGSLKDFDFQTIQVVNVY